jgi:phage tail P2-like protein
MTVTILPPQSTQTERALEVAFARIGTFDLHNADLWTPATCPSAFLPWLAYALSVDEWDGAWPEAIKRDYIAASIAIHQRKGTLWSVKRALAAAGYGTATVIEHRAGLAHDGSIHADGRYTYAANGYWADYSVVLSRPITIKQANAVRTLLASVAPARCHLRALDFQSTAILYDGSQGHAGIYTHGVA